MPLDRTQARKNISGARSGYARTIHSEFIQALANDLEEALNVLDASATDTQRAQNEAAGLQRQLDEEKTHYRKLREQSAHAEAMTALLREIAKSPKGAKAKAEKLMKTMKVAEPEAGETAVVAPEIEVP